MYCNYYYRKRNSDRSIMTKENKSSADSVEKNTDSAENSVEIGKLKEEIESLKKELEKKDKQLSFIIDRLDKEVE